ncbi:MAG: D-hexose-6-phosphate mutarotase [Akkermansiaceae bacterium]
MQTLSLLENKFPTYGSISFFELAADYPAIRVVNDFASATIALHGAHVTDYTPKSSESVIFTSSKAIYRAGKAIRGGIPICWPWFNAHPTNHDLPAHGYARTSFWVLESVSEHKAGTSLILSLPPKGESGLSASLEIHIGKSLSLTLTTTNDGVAPETYSEALHSYFCVDDSRQTLVHGLEGSSYIDTVGTETIRTQDGAVDFPDEVDRIYLSDVRTIIEDKLSARQITISKTGSDSTIVWNPGISKGSAMADLDSSEISKFVCVESGNAREQSITLAPGACHSIHLHIKA